MALNADDFARVIEETRRADLCMFVTRGASRCGIETRRRQTHACGSRCVAVVRHPTVDQVTSVSEIRSAEIVSLHLCRNATADRALQRIYSTQAQQDVLLFTKLHSVPASSPALLLRPAAFSDDLQRSERRSGQIGFRVTFLTAEHTQTGLERR